LIRGYFFFSYLCAYSFSSRINPFKNSSGSHPYCDYSRTYKKSCSSCLSLCPSYN